MSAFAGNGPRWGKNGQVLSFIPAAGATSITGQDRFGLTLAVTPGNQLVFFNDTLLARDDYTVADNGLTISGLPACSGTDVIQVIDVGVFSIADCLSKTQNGADIENKPLFRINVGVTPRGHLFGLSISNDAGDLVNDIAFAAGECAAEGTSRMMITHANAMPAKRLDANWAPGAGTGMRYSGAAIANVTYHLWAVCKANGADPDFYAHPSAALETMIPALQSETGGSAYAYGRRIGSILRSAGAILAFTQTDDEFLLKVLTTVASNQPWTTTAADQAVSVPMGIVVEALGQMQVSAGSGTAYFALYPKSVTDYTITQANAQVYATFGVNVGLANFRIRTDTSQNIRKRSSDPGGTGTINCYGWIDTRGRLA